MSRSPTPILLKEVARAICAVDAETPSDHAEGVEACWQNHIPYARAACAVIARRLREAMERGAALPASSEAKAAMMLTLVSALLEELGEP